MSSKARPSIDEKLTSDADDSAAETAPMVVDAEKGRANGHANGHSRGYANGDSNGYAPVGTSSREEHAPAKSTVSTRAVLAASVLVNVVLVILVASSGSAPAQEPIVITAPAPAPLAATGPAAGGYMSRAPQPAPVSAPIVTVNVGDELQAMMSDHEHDEAVTTERPCSGNGMKYELEETGYTDLHCECHPGFKGANCEMEDLDTPVEATVGNPMMFQGYWWDNQGALTETTAYYRIGYEASNPPVSGRIDFGGQQEVLEAAIRATHRMIGNVENIDDYQIVLSPGSGALIPAIMYAVSQQNGSPGVSIEVTSEVPYYSGYPSAVRGEDNPKFNWVEPNVAGRSGRPVVEFITSPNNPDGTVRTQTVPGSFAVYDRAYWWPHFTPIQPANDDIMMFTLSKLTGHAGSRVGWALVKDPDLAARIKRKTGSLSHDAQLRAATLLQYAVTTRGGPILYGMEQMDYRWDRFIDIFCTDATCDTPRNPRFVLRNPRTTITAMDAWTGTERRPADAYSWIECTRASDIQRTCHQTLIEAGVDTVAGDGYGGPQGSFVRLELLMAPSTFDAIANRLEVMVKGGQYRPVLPGFWQPPAIVTTMPALLADPTAPYPCSGHGIVYPVEEASLDGHCECHSGWMGRDCARADVAAPAIALSGNPLIFEEYWYNHQEANMATTPFYRLGYEAWNGPMTGRHEGWNTQMEILERAIRATHRLAGNVANIDQYHIVIGPGSGPLIPAAFYGLYEGRDIEITGGNPWYSGYPSAVNGMDNSHFTWAAQPTGRKPVLEMVTAPNNPDGVIDGPSYPGSMPVYDRAYWWPHYTPVSPVDDDIMLFTLSKLTGHAGTRIGWALVKDGDVATKMAAHIHGTGRISHDAMLRGATLLNHLVESRGAPFWFAKEKMDGRWDRLVDLLCTDSATDGSACIPRNPRFLLKNERVRGLEMDAFTGTLRRPSDPYMWLECALPADVARGCNNVMLDAGIRLSSGRGYGADPGTHIRLELLMSEDTFDTIFERLQVLLGGVGPALALPSSGPTDTGIVRPCSGNGMKYELEETGYTDLHCECHPGFKGANCEMEDLDTPVEATVGNPMMFQGYWWDNQGALTETTAYYRIGYEASNPPVSGRIDFGGQQEVLEAAIRATHRMIGNVENIDDYQIVLSPGSGALIPAIMYAVSQQNGSPGVSIEVTSEVPYYSGYPSAVRGEDNPKFNWVEPNVAGRSGRPVVEFITSPNNPDGTVRTQTVPGSFAVYDRAYWWPHFTPIQPANDDIMMFTLSKLTGHAGSRVGWALVKDPDLAARIKRKTGSLSHDAQLRAATLLQYAVTTRGGPILYGMEQMDYRWDRFIDIFCTDATCDTPRNPRFVLRNPRTTITAMDAWTGTERRPADAYSWIECTRASDIQRTCHQTLIEAGVDTVAGDGYGGPQGSFVRLELLMAPSTFDAIANRLEVMVKGGQYRPVLPGFWQPPAIVTTMPALLADPTAPYPCSGHGIVYPVEEASLDGHCECHSGWMGRDCARADVAAPAIALSGNPLIFEEYWYNHQEANMATTPFYRLGYEAWNGPMTGRHEGWNTQMEILERAIRATHRLAGNVANIDQYHIVIGPGSGPLIPAAFYGLYEGRDIEITGGNPWYSGYPSAVNGMDNSHFTWAAQPTGRKPVLEMVTAPNNPDGVIDGPSYPGSMPVYDRAYWWPHYTPVSPVDDDIMLFTLSKLTGHAGTRIGWALVKDGDVATKMAAHIHGTGRISHDAMLRGARVLNHLVESSGGPVVWAMDKMNNRWDTLIDILCTTSTTDGSACTPRNARFVLENTRVRGLEMDAFTGTARRPNDPYVWLRCADDADVQTGCGNVMSAAGMSFSSGISFGADPGTHIRLELLMTQDTFELVARRLRELVMGGR